MTALLVVLGAAVGAPLRYVADRAVRAGHDSMFPWGTLLVNVAGSALLGFLVGLPASAGWSALLGPGFCGALTTYSTLGYETVRLAEQGAGRHAVVNVVMNVTLGLAAAVGGALLAGALT
ncbi:fluoride efflux transporter FluC [Nonomuraea sp. NPDC048826]|uniref:fluoride efflux transporter FluC n=1 Tax=Nonomuraea sp. NPDC048826 TaxID=3364347 RepID=UPI00372185F6